MQFDGHGWFGQQCQRDITGHQPDKKQLVSKGALTSGPQGSDVIVQHAL